MDSFDDTTNEHSDLADRLRAERPQLTAIEMDGVKQRVLAGSSRAFTRRFAPLKSRLALTLMLVSGLMMTSTGATLAVTGIAGDGSASVSQYGRPGPTTQTPANTIGPDDGSTLGVGEEDPGAGTGNPGNEDEGAVKGEIQSSDDSSGGSGTKGSAKSGSGVQASQQVAAAGTDDDLPFTGFLVFPLLIAGVALIAVGGTMRLRLRRDQLT